MEDLIKGKTIVVWFSCGAASAVAAKLTIEKYGRDNNVIIVNTPILEEHPDNKRFLYDVEKWLGVGIITKTAKAFPASSIVEVFDKRKFMSSVYGAICTKALKKQARYEMEKDTDIDFHVLGFTYDELDRHNRFVTFERKNTLPVLIDNKISKSECFNILADAGIKIPTIYSLGFPNANCIGCVKASGIGYWQLVRRHFPEVFASRCEQSRRLGCKLTKVGGKRIFLDELPESAKGRKVKSWDCGIFCSEY